MAMVSGDRGWGNEEGLSGHLDQKAPPVESGSLVRCLGRVAFRLCLLHGEALALARVLTLARIGGLLACAMAFAG